MITMKEPKALCQLLRPRHHSDATTTRCWDEELGLKMYAGIQEACTRVFL